MKGLGLLYLVCMLVHVVFALAFNLLVAKGFTFPNWLLLIFSELTILIPSIIYILKNDLGFKDDLGFRPIKAGSVFMCILLAALVTPLASFVNIVSQFFVSNTLVQKADSLSGMSTVTLIFLGGIYGPFCEEFLFRSIFFGRYEKYMGPMRAGLVSALLFALAHMNVNQAMYVFVIGVIFAIVNEAAGSVFPSLIIHISINIVNLLELAAAQSVQNMLGDGTDLVAAAEAVRHSDAIYVMAGVMLVLTVICCAIAIPVTVWISKHEGHFDDLYAMFTKKHPHVKWLNGYMTAALIFVLFIMFGLDPLLGLIGKGA